MPNQLTPIPNKLSVLEQSFVFLPKIQKISRLSTEKRPKYDSSVDACFPTMTATSCLFNYLAPLRSMRQESIDEDHLLVYMSAPTFGFCLKIGFVASYNFTKIETNKKDLQEGEEVQLREKTLKTLMMIGEKATYLTQLMLNRIDFEECRLLILRDVLPKLHRLEVFTFCDWPNDSLNSSIITASSLFVKHENEHKIVSLLPTVFASTHNLVSLALKFNGDLPELRLLLSQVTKSLRTMALTGKSANYIVPWLSRTCQIDSSVLNVISTWAPKLTSLTLIYVLIDAGFCKNFGNFRGMRELTINNAKCTSKDPLELQYLQEALGGTLQKLVFMSPDLGKISGHDPLHALSGRLIQDPNSGAVTLSESLIDTLSFPFVTHLECNYGVGIDLDTCCSVAFHHLAFPALTRLDLNAYVSQHAAPLPFLKVIEFICGHRNLQTLRLPGSQFETRSVEEINRGFNMIGENLHDLRELQFSLRFPSTPSWGEKEDSQKITFETWKNMTKMERLTCNFINNNLMQIIGEHWKSLKHFAFGGYSIGTTRGFISDEGLDAFSKITLPPVDKQQNQSDWRTPLENFYIDCNHNITDEGVARCLKQIRENAGHNNFGLSGVTFSDCCKVGRLTCKAIRKYHNEAIDLDFQKTLVDADCFEDIAKCNRVTVLFFDSDKFDDPEIFIPIAKGLRELTYLDLFGCDRLTDEDWKVDRLHEIFGEQIRTNDLYIGTHRT